jgi:hypothetical protein
MAKNPSIEQAQIDALRGSAPTRTPTVRALAAFSSHTTCPTATLAFAAGVDLDRLPTGTAYEMPFGASPFHFSRGESFEALVKRDRYGLLLSLLRDQLGFAVADAKVIDLRSAYPKNREGLRLRAHETKRLLAEIARQDPDAVNLIDGAVLSTNIGGSAAYFEADSLSARFGGQLYVGEIKSFPVVDGRGDPEKVGTALDQASMYAHLTCETVTAVGGDQAIVAREALLITPKNVGLTPTMSVVDIAKRMARVRKLLAAAPDIQDLIAKLPAGSGFAEACEEAGDEQSRLEAIHSVLDSVGNHYTPDCLKDCGLARICRERAFQSGAPTLVGPKAIRTLPGVSSLPRAEELASGAPPAAAERAAAEQLARAERLYDRALRAAGGQA